MKLKAWRQLRAWCVAAMLMWVCWPAANAQEGDLAEAQRLNNQVIQDYAAGRYAQAIALAQRVLAIDEQALGPEHPGTATALNNLAALYKATGAYAKVEPLYQRALAINEKVLGSEHPDTAVSLNNLATLHLATGDYAEVELLCWRALAILEKEFDSEHPDTATSLNNLAALYYATGAYAKAEPLYQRTLAILEKALGPEHPDTAALLNNLAELYRATGDYAKAMPLFQRALAIREKALGPEHPDTAAPLNNLAELYRAIGDYAKAVPLNQRALAILEMALGPEHPDTVRALNNLAELYQASGAYAKAEPLYQRALAISEKALGPEHPDTATFLNNLAELYRATGAYAKAEPLYQRALAIRGKTLGPEHPDTATSLNNLAVLYRANGAYAKAESLHQRALAILENVLGPEHPDTATFLNNLAELYRATGAYAKAEPLYQRAQDIDEINTTRILIGGDEASKRAYLQQLVGRVNANVSFSLTVDDPRARALGLTAVLRYKSRALDAMADNVARLRRGAEPKDQALLDELAGVMQQWSNLTFRGPGQLSAQAYRERLDALAGEQGRLEGELSVRSAVFRQALAPVTLDGVRQELPAGAALVELFRYRPFDFKARDSKTQWGAPRYVAYVLRREGEPAVIDLGAAQDIDALVRDFRAALVEPVGTSYKPVAQQLYGRLIKPLRSFVSGIDRLLLSPDGELNLLPFAALMDDEHGDYVVQHIEVTYLTSGRDLLTLASEPARGSAVVIANPDYGPGASSQQTVSSEHRSIDLDRSGLKFRPLPGTADEAKALQRLLKLDAREVLTGANATEEKIKGLHGPRILHAATHGFFLSDQQVAAGALRPVGLGAGMPLPPQDENPLLRSGLALAGANARSSGVNDDGILTAAEAAQLDLRGTQLVVLSACETGLGQVQEGEGVYGLRRALVLAGAQAQLMSLWQADDAQTRALMVDYYERLLRGEGRSAALREVQKAMIANPVTQHPHYWAAFVPIGNWTPLIVK